MFEGDEYCPRDDESADIWHDFSRTYIPGALNFGAGLFTPDTEMFYIGKEPCSNIAPHVHAVGNFEIITMFSAVLTNCRRQLRNHGKNGYRHGLEVLSGNGVKSVCETELLCL